MARLVSMYVVFLSIMQVTESLKCLEKNRLTTQQPHSVNCSRGFDEVCFIYFKLFKDFSIHEELSGCFDKETCTIESESNCLTRAKPPIKEEGHICCCQTDNCNGRVTLLMLEDDLSVTKIESTLNTDSPNATELGPPAEVAIVVPVVIILVIAVIIVTTTTGIIVYKKICKQQQNLTTIELGQIVQRTDTESNGNFVRGTMEVNGQANKVAFKDFHCIKDFNKELQICKLLQSSPHPHMIKFLGHNKKILYFQHHPRGSIYDRINATTLSLQEFALLASTMAKGLEFLHCLQPRPIIHGDIKSDNVVINNEGESVLVEFGSSFLKPDNGAKEYPLFRGTIYNYQAPEILKKKAPIENWLAIDIYSLGIVLWELLTRTRIADEAVSGYRRPYYDSSYMLETSQIQELVEHGRPEIPVKILEHHRKLAEMVKSLWHGNALARPPVGMASSFLIEFQEELVTSSYPCQDSPRVLSLLDDGSPQDETTL